ncbi:MAG: hypothetical protein JSS81_25655 [Acidobacteria bacterium]|nr:hypothetical protein [Acidobacteriota bacterium]
MKKNPERIDRAARLLAAPLALTFFCLACSLVGGGSPTSVYKSFLEAARKKDAATMKGYLSASSLDALRSAAKYGNSSEDKILTEVPPEQIDPVEISGEKIEADGRSASLEVKLKNDKTQTIYFVKEGSWKIALEKQKPVPTATATPAASPGGDSTVPGDSGPVTISASALIDEAKSGGSGLDTKYGGRMLTVTGAELWEIQYSMLHIGAKYGSYSSGYIICEGSFSEYQPYASKIADLRKAGKSPGATVKGTFSRVAVDGGYTQVHLSPCVLADLEKP